MPIQTLEKNSILNYFEILKDKFFKIIILNSIYFACISLLLVVIMGISALITNIFGEVSDLWTLLTFLPLIILGPITSAIIKLMRDFVRGEPGFFLQDFIKAFKDNFKQSIIIALFQYVVVWAVIIAARFYYALADEGLFYTIGLGVTFFVGIAIVVASYYFYMMTVTLKLTVKEIIKNSFIFTMLCFLRNVVLTVVLALWLLINAMFVYFAVISANAFLYGITICLFMLLTFGIFFYTVAFFTFPPIKKYILDPYYEEHPLESSKSVSDKPSADDINYNAEDQEKELPEFVYHNGKMVYRNALEEERVFSDERIYSENENNR